MSTTHKHTQTTDAEGGFMNAQRWDILGFGIVAVDDLLMVESYPPPDAKTAVLEKSRQGGGLTGTALVAASRLGAKCAYGGVLGDDELSAWTLRELEGEGVDCASVIYQPNARPYHSIIIVDKTHHTRNIFFSGVGVTPRPLNEIDATLVSQARVLFVDHEGIESMLHAVTLAQKLGIPTVADIERSEHPKTDELIAQIDHLILSANFACKFTGKDDPVKAVESLHKNTQRACTAVTVGKEGCWYISAENNPPPPFGKGEGSIQHHPAFEVQVVDTTGCGDVFHGAYAAGIAWGWPVSRCIRFAAAAAAIKATKAGGRKGIPDRSTVFQFLTFSSQKSPTDFPNQ
jgi:sugar/nucleoside kinase (ribokinase family)